MTDQEGRDAHVDVIDLGSAQRVQKHTLRFGAGDLAFTRDGRLLVAASCCTRGSTVFGWDARSGARRFSVPTREDAETFSLSADSREIAVGTGDGHAIVFDLHSGGRRGAATKVAGAGIAQIAFSPDRRLLAVGAYDRTATIWDVHTRTRVGDTVPVAKGFVPAVGFEPSGRLLISDGGATEWPIDVPTLQRFACQVAGRDLTREEWAALLPNRPYRRACPTGG